MNTKKLFLLLKRNPARLLGAVRNRLTGYTPPVGKACITQLEIQTLQRYAKAAHEGIVEIGVLDAGTTRELGLVAHVPIYGIDPLIPDSIDNALQGSEAIIQNNMSFYTDFHFFQDYSQHLAPSWKKKFDFLFIDGDHTYDAVKKDASDWILLLSSGGYVAFHDAAPVLSDPTSTHVGYEGPMKLVEELKRDTTLEYIETKDSLVVFRKH